VNCVIELETDLSPKKLLALFQEVEQQIGKHARPDGSRHIDLDLLLYEGFAVEEDTLTVPHERMHERRFVLVPLAEIAPTTLHPIIGKPIQELLNDCEEESNVQKR